MESTQTLTFKAIVIGATGATGREVTDILLKSPYWSNITVLVRRKIDIWDKLDKDQSEKLKIIQCEDLEILSQNPEDLNTLLSGIKFDTVFCCLGSRTKNKDFVKVDYTYVLESALLCEKLQIPHFSLISSKGVDSKSCFKYLSTKGKADEDVMKTKVSNISIFRPGAILGRENDKRCGESLLKCLPCFPKINVINLARGIVNEATNLNLNNNNSNRQENKNGIKKIYTHNEIVNLSNGEVRIA